MDGEHTLGLKLYREYICTGLEVTLKDSKVMEKDELVPLKTFRTLPLPEEFSSTFYLVVSFTRSDCS